MSGLISRWRITKLQCAETRVIVLFVTFKLTKLKILQGRPLLPGLYVTLDTSSYSPSYPYSIFSKIKGDHVSRLMNTHESLRPHDTAATVRWSVEHSSGLCNLVFKYNNSCVLPFWGENILYMNCNESTEKNVQNHHPRKLCSIPICVSMKPRWIVTLTACYHIHYRWVYQLVKN